MTLLLSLAALLVVAAAAASSARTSPGQRRRRYSRADVRAAVDLAVRAHPDLPAYFVWAMADKESGLDPQATRRDRREDSWGLFQVNWRAHGEELTRRGIDRQDLLDPLVNAAYWSELASGLRSAAIAREFSGDWIWYAVRLRLKGIGWNDFGGGVARTAVLAFIPYLERWRTRLG